MPTSVREVLSRVKQAGRHAVQALVGAPERRTQEKLNTDSVRYFASRPDRAAAFEAAGGTFSTGMMPCQYQWLHETIVSRQPRVIYEFGSGASTCIVAQALSEIGSGLVISFEDQPRFHDHARSLMPAAFSSFARFELREKRASTVLWEDRRLWGFHYASWAGERPDLIIVDGPSVSWTEGSAKGICLDIVLYLARIGGDEKIDVLFEGKRRTIGELAPLLLRQPESVYARDMHAMFGVTLADLRSHAPTIVADAVQGP